MNQNESIIRIINSASQNETNMVNALTNYGNGHMGVGLLKFADWGVRIGKTKGLQQGRIEGALVAGLFSTALLIVSGYFLERQFLKEERRNQDEMFDLLDDITAAHAELKSAALAAEKTKEGDND